MLVTTDALYSPQLIATDPPASPGATIQLGSDYGLPVFRADAGSADLAGGGAAWALAARTLLRQRGRPPVNCLLRLDQGFCSAALRRTAAPSFGRCRSWWKSPGFRTAEYPTQRHIAVLHCSSGGNYLYPGGVLLVWHQSEAGRRNWEIAAIRPPCSGKPDPRNLSLTL